MEGENVISILRLLCYQFCFFRSPTNVIQIRNCPNKLLLLLFVMSDNFNGEKKRVKTKAMMVAAVRL